MHKLKRSVLVTGASSGIGKAVVSRLLAEEHRVIGLSRRVSDATFSHERFQADAIDLTDLDRLPGRVSALLERCPEIDAAVFCAGRGRFGSLEEFSLDQIRELMDLNFTSQAFIARSLIPRFKRKHGGDMIFVGSEAALAGSRKGAIYCASKFALRGFTQALREECGKSGIRVTLINPGMVRSPFFEELDFEPADSPRNAIESGDVAELVCSIFELRAETVIDEINLSPLSKVIRFKS